MSSPKEIAIRVWGLLFALTFGVAWAALGVIPMLIICFVAKDRAVGPAFQIWLWPIDLASHWMNYGRDE